MIFVDTGAWFASIVPSDSDYAAAVSWLSSNSEPCSNMGNFPTILR